MSRSRHSKKKVGGCNCWWCWGNSPHDRRLCEERRRRKEADAEAQEYADLPYYPFLCPDEQ